MATTSACIVQREVQEHGPWSNQGHCNETFAGAFREASGILSCPSLGQLFGTSVEAESLYIPNQDKDCLLKTADGAIPVRFCLWLCGSDLRHSILRAGGKEGTEGSRTTEQ